MRPWKASKLQLQLDRAIAWREHAEYLNRQLQARIDALRAANEQLQRLNAAYFKAIPKAAPLDASGKMDVYMMPTGVKPPEPPRKGVVARNADGDLCIKWVPRHKSKWRPYSKWEYDPPI